MMFLDGAMFKLNPIFEKAKNEYISSNRLIECAEIFKKINDEERSYVIFFFIDSHIPQKVISQICGISESAISQRLSVLKKRRLNSNLNRINQLHKIGLSNIVIAEMLQKHSVDVTPDDIESFIRVKKYLTQISLE